jgi:hypothetical protein
MTLGKKPAGRGPSDRRGPIERALSTRDRDLLITTVESRSASDGNGCWVWKGAKNQNGYAYCGRLASHHIVHRIVAWAEAGFPGELRTFPPVGHACGQRACVNPQHLSPVTSHMNSIEASLRNALLRRIKALEEVVRLFDAEHEVLDYPQLKNTSHGHAIGNTRSQVHPAATVRRFKQKGDFEERQRLNSVRRFEQVLAVRKYRADGLNVPESLAKVGISRAVFDDWKGRLDELRR